MPEPWVNGQIHAVPCPNCGKQNDFRPLKDYGCESGNVVSCDYCTQMMEIVKVQAITVISVRKTNQRGNLR